MHHARCWAHTLHARVHVVCIIRIIRTICAAESHSRASHAYPLLTLHRASGTVLIRPPDFQSHEVDYIITTLTAVGQKWPATAVSSTGTSTASAAASRVVQYDCRRVPVHLRDRHWEDLLATDAAQQLTDRMVMLRGSALCEVILSRIEDPAYIHAYTSGVSGSASIGTAPGRSAAGVVAVASSPRLQLLLELPRYSLEFKLCESGRLHSLDYSGYCLRAGQQLVQGDAANATASTSDDSNAAAKPLPVAFTLPGFYQYLVLERLPAGSGTESKGSAAPPPITASKRADLLVLVPRGGVGRDAAGWDSTGLGCSGNGTGLPFSRVRVVVAADCSAHVKVRRYGRFGTPLLLSVQQESICSLYPPVIDSDI